MSSAGSTPPNSASISPMAATSSIAPSPTDKLKEIKLISHSPLFYWWPVWFLSFLFAFITFIGDGHMAILPGKARVAPIAGSERKFEFNFDDSNKREGGYAILNNAVERSLPAAYEEPFPMKVSESPALGVLFCVA